MTIAIELAKLADNIHEVNRDQAAETLRAALARGTSAAVAQAATLVGRLELTQLDRELCAAFERFTGERMRADKHCLAKLEIVKALHKIGAERAAPYAMGMTCYWPSRPLRNSRDLAAELRIAAAQAYAELGSTFDIDDLASLLGDPVADVRLAAVSCVAALGSDLAGTLLRLKAQWGDDSPSVTGACFEELLARDKERHFPFVAGHLESPEERTRTHAALAIGQSRHPEGLDVLAAAWKRTFDRDFKRELLVSIALLRTDRALEFLLLQLEGPGEPAHDALEALSSCHMPQVRLRVREVLDRIGDEELLEKFDTLFR